MAAGINKCVVFFFPIHNRFLHLVKIIILNHMTQRTTNPTQAHGETFNQMLAHGDLTHLL